MLYIVGGASRCGKTTLAQQMLARHGVPWFSLDGLRVGLTRGLPSLGLDMERDDLVEAKGLWPVIRPMLSSIVYWDTDYLVEGSCLLPEDIAAFMAEHADETVRTVFVGAPFLSPSEKLAQMQAHTGGTNDWFSDLSEEEQARHADYVVANSRQINCLAQEAGLPSVDTGTDFQAGVEKVRDCLMRLTD